MGVPDLWEHTRGRGVRVGLFDSGVRKTDWAEGVVERRLRWDGRPEHPAAAPPSPHGTRCASLLACDLQEARGVAPEVSITSVCVADALGGVPEARLKAAFELAARERFDVVSCSLTMKTYASATRDVVAAYLRGGGLLVAASGRPVDAWDPFPRLCTDAVVVGGRGAIEPGSFGSAKRRVDVWAPGGRLPVVDRLHSRSVVLWQARSSGATALVAGVVSLVLSYARDRLGRRLPPEVLVKLIRDRGSPEAAADAGSGDVLDAGKLLEAVRDCCQPLEVVA